MMDTNRVDLGSIQIHKKAIADIAVSALAELDGVALMPADLIFKAKELLGYRAYPGISVSVDKNNQVSIELKVMIRYGISVHDIGRQIQETVRTAVERTVDLSLKDVHVNIHGIERGKE